MPCTCFLQTGCSSSHFSKLLHTLKWKYDGTIYLTVYYSQYCRSKVQIRISYSRCKQQKQLWILFYTFWKIPTGKFPVKFWVQLLPANMGFVNYSVLKFSQDFHNKVAFQRCSTEVVVHQLTLWWNILTFTPLLQSWRALHVN